MERDYSVVVPAYNESAWIGATLVSIQSAMAASPLKGEIIVTDNNSSDDTAEIARSHGARVVFEPVNQISRSRNTGAREAQGKYLVFVDADTIVLPALLRQALANLESGRCIGGGAVVRFERELGVSVHFVEEIWLSRKLRKIGRAQQKRFCIIRDHAAQSSGRKVAWYNTWRQIGLLLMVVFTPFFVRYKRFCGYWYDRPDR
jgi:glycosyltransferase involved in cell wall biosynthesis